MRDFDPSAHRPHPPGYPVFIALGKVSASLLGQGREAAALAIWGALLGASAAFPLTRLFRALGADRSSTIAATALTLASPLVWFNAARPMSDVPGWSLSLIAQAFLATAFVSRRARMGEQGAPTELLGRYVVAGAFVAALAAGVRVQAMWLTLPLLALVILDWTGRGASGAILGSALAFSIGVLLWAVPLIWASGGLNAYLSSLASQAGEDVVGVPMLAFDLTPRALATALDHTLLQPWAFAPLAVTVLSLAALGAVVTLFKNPRALILLTAAFGPYGLFHLLFQETIMTRYAVPLVVVVAYLAVSGLRLLGTRALTVASMALVTMCGIVSVPATSSYARHASPAFQAISDLNAGIRETLGHPIVAMHHVFKRVVQAGGVEASQILPAPPRGEWLQLVQFWRQGGREPIWFLADPRRTDLALIDPQSRRVETRYRWSFDSERFISGVRPNTVDLVSIASPPGWVCGEGWHLTPETAGVAATNARPQVEALVRRREDEAILLVGGRNLGSASDPEARITIRIGGDIIDELNVKPQPGFFVRMIELPAGRLRGDGPFATLTIAHASVEPRRPVRVGIEQFNVQAASSVVYAFADGWHEQEFNPVTGRQWRWSSDRASTLVHHGGQDLTLAITGESPLRYFDQAPAVTVKVGNEVLFRAAPLEDFAWTVRVPAHALDQAGGLLMLETDQVFVPSERSDSGDRRRLGLRIYGFELR